MRFTCFYAVEKRYKPPVLLLLLDLHSGRKYFTISSFESPKICTKNLLHWLIVRLCEKVQYFGGHNSKKSGLNWKFSEWQEEARKDQRLYKMFAAMKLPPLKIRWSQSEFFVSRNTRPDDFILLKKKKTFLCSWIFLFQSIFFDRTFGIRVQKKKLPKINNWESEERFVRCRPWHVLAHFLRTRFFVGI